MQTISKQLETIAEQICDKYCKYPEQYTNAEWDKMMEEDKLPCNDCPLMKL